jgi:dimethylglycine dehydrogenase
MDLSSFAKFDVRGPDAHAHLSWLCANRVPTRDGGVVLGHFLTDDGFIESEVTITRLGPEHYFLLCSGSAEYQDLDVLRRLPSDGRQLHGVRYGSGDIVRNVTEEFGSLVLAGPQSRQVLKACTSADLTTGAFPWLAGRVITVAGVAGVRVLRINYVGELGYELHVPMAEMPKVFNGLMEEGRAHGIRLFGTYAMNSLRMEKAYRSFGGDLTSEVTLIEAGMERFIQFGKSFRGKAGTLNSKQHGPRMSLVYLDIVATDSDSRGNEPVFREGRLVGVTTGGAYGHAVGKSLAFAYVEPELAVPGMSFDVQLYGEMHAARLIPEPAYDPLNERLRV